MTPPPDASTTKEAKKGQSKGVLPSLSARLDKLPTYVFAELDELKARARARGADLIDLGMGNPDMATPSLVVEAIQKGVQNPENHRYPNLKGKPEYRQAVARWMERRFGVKDIDPETEVQALIGSKEGLAHLSFAYINNGDVTITPSLYYPVHSRATWLSGGDVHHLPMSAERGFIPDLKNIPDEIARRAKLFIVSYPNNPTTALANEAFYSELVAYCKKYGIILVSDLAYSEIAFDGYKPLSIFNIPGAKEIAVEFHSFSKTFNMAGWRVGFAVGNAQIIKSLYSIKTNLDYGISSAIQDGAIAALDHSQTLVPPIVKEYQERRDILVEGFRALGWPIETPSPATIYMWLPIPKNNPAVTDSKSWVKYLLDTADVVVTPGIAFGSDGDQYFRVSLVSPKAVLHQALDRLKEKGIRYS
ncbi:MAG: aminotransferase class I/II-fold pyridoxal phosphate-dependent enzyme [Vampirovibrionales bacterium]|nr:aminotransferase class I/II-fold pyridoxal phosphate-dependent enzyme [Vampirovibrionales bacterium]